MNFGPDIKIATANGLFRQGHQVQSTLRGFSGMAINTVLLDEGNDTFGCHLSRVVRNVIGLSG